MVSATEEEKKKIRAKIEELKKNTTARERNFDYYQQKAEKYMSDKMAKRRKSEVDAQYEKAKAKK